MTVTTPAGASSIAELERLKVLHNGEKVQLTFSDAEFERRLAGLRRIMAAKELDAVVLTSYHSIKYYSDFLFTYFGRSYAMVVTADDTVTVTANIDAGMPWRRSYGENIVYTDWRRDNYIFAIQEALRTRGISPRRLGVEDDSLPLDNREQDPGRLRTAPTLVDVAQAAMRQRMIKSAEEIEVIKHGARIGDLGGEAIRNAITAGHHRVRGRPDRHRGHGPRDRPHLPGHARSATPGSGSSPASTPTARTTGPPPARSRNDDILSLNCFPMTSGYYTALERTLFYGEPDARSLELWNINVEVHQRGLELIKPGAVCKDIAAELNEIYVGHGLLANRTFGYGHSFGVLQPLLRPGSRPGAARGHRHRAGAGHGGLDGTDDHGPGRPARRRRLPRARHPGGRRGRRGEHHQVPVRPGAQHHRRLTPGQRRRHAPVAPPLPSYIRKDGEHHDTSTDD